MREGIVSGVIVTNADYFPISVVAMWGELTLADVEVMRRHYRAMHERNARFASFVDSRHSFVPSAPMRRALAEMSNEFEVASKRTDVCVAIALDSKLLVGVLTAVRWFLKTESDLRYFKTPTAALAYICERFTAEQIKLAPATAVFFERLDAADETSLHNFGDGRDG